MPNEPREFVRVNMSDLRARPGEILDAVSSHGRIFLIERKGHPLACLAPVSDFMPDIPEARLAQELRDLDGADEHFSVTVDDERQIVIRVPGASAGDKECLKVTLPHGYPAIAPIIKAESVVDGSPHRWPDGSLCVYGMMKQWNPGRDGVLSTIALGRSWLLKYHEWCATQTWPEGLA